MKKCGYMLIALGICVHLEDPVKQDWLVYGR